MVLLLWTGQKGSWFWPSLPWGTRLPSLKAHPRYPKWTCYLHSLGAFINLFLTSPTRKNYFVFNIIDTGYFIFGGKEAWSEGTGEEENR